MDKPYVLLIAGLVLLMAVSGFEVMAMENSASLNSFNVTYQVPRGKDTTRAFLDIYPARDKPGAPVVVFWHGGALMQGDKQLVGNLARTLADQGVAVVAANYRLSPAVQHPAHLQDAAAAVNWVKSHIKEYGGDPAKLFLSGHSAGAYLAVQLALDSRYLAEHGLTLTDLAGVVAISPFLYVEEVAPQRPKVVWGKDPAGWLEPSVSGYVGAGKPPLRLLYAAGDEPWRRSQNERLARDLMGFEVDAQALMVPNRNHRSIMTRADHRDDPVVEAIYLFISGEE
jgi:acetyl esterase/lipase